MQKHDSGRFKQIIANISANYQKATDEAYTRFLWSAFKHHSIDEFERAAMAHIMCPTNGKFFPTVAHLMEKLNGTAKEREIEQKACAQVAWGEVVEAIARIGPYQDLKMDDQKALAAIRDLGGWKKLCNMTHSQLDWTKKDFIQIYEGYQGVESRRLPSHLNGIESTENQKRIESDSMKNISNKLMERLATDTTWAK